MKTYLVNQSFRGTAKSFASVEIETMGLGIKSRANVVGITIGLALFIIVQLIPTEQSFGQNRKYQEYGFKIRLLVNSAQYSEALRVAQSYVSATEGDEGQDSVAYANAISLKAYVLFFRNESDSSTRLFERALTIYRKRNAPKPMIAKALNNLGQVYQGSGRLSKAELLYKRALKLQQASLPSDHTDISSSLANLAHVQQKRSKYKEAEALLRRVLSMREKGYPLNHPIIAATLQNLATAIESQGRLAEAERLLRQALRMRRASQPPHHPQLAGAVHRLGVNLYRQSKYAQAIEFLNNAITIRRRSSAFLPDLARNLTDLAQIYILYGKYQTAHKLLSEAMEMFQKTLPPNHVYIAGVNRDLAYVEEGRKRLSRALEHSRRASEIYESRHARGSAARIQFQNHVKLVWAMSRSIINPGDKDILTREAFRIAQQGSVTDTATSIARMATRLASKDPALRSAIRERQDLKLQLKREEGRLITALASKDTRSAALAIRGTIEAISKRITKIDRKIQADFPRYQRLVRPLPLKVSQVQEFLGEGEALVFFYLTYDSGFVWAITANKIAWRKLKIGPAKIGKLVGKLRSGLDARDVFQTAKRDTLFQLGNAYRLYKGLFGAIEATISNKDQLIIVSSGALTSLPYTALVTSPPKVNAPKLEQFTAYYDAQWFVRKWAITILPAVNNIKPLRQLDRSLIASRSLVGFGNPLFALPTAGKPSGVARKPSERRPQRTDGRFARVSRVRGFSTYWSRGLAKTNQLRTLDPLPRTQTELVTVAKYLGSGDAKLFFGAQASEANVKSAALAQYRIVYFATHALVAGDIASIGEPALALSVPAKATALDDGLLTASEVAQLKLNADWVILSACNTATSRGPGAEALSGLAQSFFYAGSRALLVSHWSVDDASTAYLMTKMFEVLSAQPKLGRAKALQRAILTLQSDRSDPWNAYPAFWAPFFIVGLSER